MPRAARPSRGRRSCRGRSTPTTGSPASADDARAPRRMPPSGCALITSRSAARASATASGSSARRTLSSAAIGMPMYFVRRRISASSSTRRTRLLDVLEVERRERVDGVLGLVDVPAAVRVDADAALGAERLAHGANAGDILRQGLVARSRPSPSPYGIRGIGRARPHAVGVDRRHGRVHRDPVAQRRRAARPAVVDRRGQPGGCLGVVVLGERRELRPPLRSLEQHRLAHVDAAEPGHEREGDHPRGGEQLVGEGRGAASSVTPPSWHRPARGIRNSG